MFAHGTPVTHVSRYENWLAQTIRYRSYDSGFSTKEGVKLFGSIFYEQVITSFSRIFGRA